MLGPLSTHYGTNTERNCVALQRKQKDRGRSSWHKNWRSWGRRNRYWTESVQWEFRYNRPLPCSQVFLWTAGVPGDAKTVGHSAPPGAGEREADAFGAAEAHHPDEGPDACFLSSLCPGTHFILHLASDWTQPKDNLVSKFTWYCRNQMSQ